MELSGANESAEEVPNVHEQANIESESIMEISGANESTEEVPIVHEEVNLVNNGAVSQHQQQKLDDAIEEIWNTNNESIESLYAVNSLNLYANAYIYIYC